MGTERILALANLKGGTGKTTSAVNIAHGLALQGYEVLLVDLDVQGNCAPSLGLDYEYTTYDLIVEGELWRRCLVEAREKLWLLPSDQQLAEVKDHIIVQATMASLRGKPNKSVLTLREAMAPVDGFDFIICDLAPSMDIINLNALFYAKEALVPVSLEYLATVGVSQLLENVIEAQGAGSEIELKMVIPTFYERVTVKSRQILEQLEDLFGPLLCTPIPKSVRLSEAPSYHQTIWEYDGQGKAAKAYGDIIERILNG